MRWVFFCFVFSSSLFVIWFTHSAAVTEGLRGAGGGILQGSLADPYSAWSTQRKTNGEECERNRWQGSHICAATQLLVGEVANARRTGQTQHMGEDSERPGAIPPGQALWCRGEARSYQSREKRRRPETNSNICVLQLQRLVYRSHHAASFCVFSLPLGQTVELIHRFCVQTCWSGNFSLHVKTCKISKSPAHKSLISSARLLANFDLEKTGVVPFFFFSNSPFSLCSQSLRTNRITFNSD